MTILVINAGSTSVKFVFGEQSGNINLLKTGQTHAEAVSQIVESLDSNPEAVGYRVVFGGDFTAPTLLDESTVDTIAEFSEQFPLHIPPAVATIRACMEQFPSISHVAVFDTSYHTTIENDDYFLAPELGYKRYGFHGINHEYIAQQGQDLGYDRVISCHLGGGASVCLSDLDISGGVMVSKATTMGYGAAEGLPMATRCGDVDPEIVLDLVRKHGVEAAANILYKQSGFKAFTDEPFFDAMDSDLQKKYALKLASKILSLLPYSQYIVECRHTLVVFTGGLGENNGEYLAELIAEHLPSRWKFETMVADEEGMIVKKVRELIG